MKRCGTLLLIAALLLLLAAGCDEGGGGEDLAAPEYDLTGCWEVEEQPVCEADVAPAADLRGSGIDFEDLLTDAELDGVGNDFVDADPLRLQQANNDLTITETDSGHQVEGTISGDQVLWQDDEVLLGFETEWEAKGTALTENVVALTVTYTFSPQEVEGALVCKMRLERMVGAPAGCIAGPAEQAGE